MRRAQCVLGVLLAAAAAGCHRHREPPAAAPGPAASDSIVLERTPCFGACPTYVLTITGSALATFDGTGRLRGRHGVDTLAAGAVDALFSRIDSAHTWELAEHYTPGHPAQCSRYATDMPGAVLTIRRGTRRKQIEHYYGCAEAPAVLRDIESAVDSVAGVDRWITAGSDLEPRPPR